MKWISVEDRLPSEEECNAVGKFFLVVCRTFGGYEGSFVSVEIADFYPYEPVSEWLPMERTPYWEIISDKGPNIPFQITHWMPLPEAPK